MYIYSSISFILCMIDSFNHHHSHNTEKLHYSPDFFMIAPCSQILLYFLTLGSHWSLLSLSFTFFRMLRRWNHTEYNFLKLVSFTKHNAFEIH